MEAMGIRRGGIARPGEDPSETLERADKFLYRS